MKSPIISKAECVSLIKSAFSYDIDTVIRGIYVATGGGDLENVPFYKEGNPLIHLDGLVFSNYFINNYDGIDELSLVEIRKQNSIDYPYREYESDDLYFSKELSISIEEHYEEHACGCCGDFVAGYRISIKYNDKEIAFVEQELYTDMDPIEECYKFFGLLILIEEVNLNKIREVNNFRFYTPK